MKPLTLIQSISKELAALSRADTAAQKAAARTHRSNMRLRRGFEKSLHTLSGKIRRAEKKHNAVLDAHTALMARRQSRRDILTARLHAAQPKPKP